MRANGLVSILLLFISATSAWPTGWNPLSAAKAELAPLIARQNNNNNNDNNNNNNNNNNNAASSSSAPPASSSSSQKNGKATSTNKNGKTTAKNGQDAKKTTSKYQTTKSFDPRLPAGGVSMITPAAIAGPQYYKIGNSRVKEFITFAWNYTSLSVTPTAVDILASCSLNSATYTIAANQTVKGHTGAVTWDTGEYQRTASIPLVIATYTLIIYDADSSPDALPRAGYLGTYNQLQFGMYSPQPITPMADFVCATCNGAMSSMERHTLGFLFGMVAVTVVSFGWFAGVAGLW